MANSAQTQPSALAILAVLAAVIVAGSLLMPWLVWQGFSPLAAVSAFIGLGTLVLTLVLIGGVALVPRKDA